VEVSCEQGNEIWRSIKITEFLDLFLKKGSCSRGLVRQIGRLLVS
jgi:hypothetical protein